MGGRLAIVVVAIAGGCAGWRTPSGEKSGPLMVNVKGGPAIGLHDSAGAGRPEYSTGAGGVDVAVAVTPDRRGYVVASPPPPKPQPSEYVDAYTLVGFADKGEIIAEAANYPHRVIPAGVKVRVPKSMLVTDAHIFVVASEWERKQAPPTPT